MAIVQGKYRNVRRVAGAHSIDAMGFLGVAAIPQFLVEIPDKGMVPFDVHMEFGMACKQGWSTQTEEQYTACLADKVSVYEKEIPYKEACADSVSTFFGVLAAGYFVSAAYHFFKGRKQNGPTLS